MRTSSKEKLLQQAGEERHRGSSEHTKHGDSSLTCPAAHTHKHTHTLKAAEKSSQEVFCSAMADTECSQGQDGCRKALLTVLPAGTVSHQAPAVHCSPTPLSQPASVERKAQVRTWLNPRVLSAKPKDTTDRCFTAQNPTSSTQWIYLTASTQGSANELVPEQIISSCFAIQPPAELSKPGHATFTEHHAGTRLTATRGHSVLFLSTGNYTSRQMLEKLQ